MSNTTPLIPTTALLASSFALHCDRPHGWKYLVSIVLLVATSQMHYEPLEVNLPPRILERIALSHYENERCVIRIIRCPLIATRYSDMSQSDALD